MKGAILAQWDLNHDGKINKMELSMLLLQQSRMAGDGDEDAAQSEQSTYSDDEWIWLWNIHSFIVMLFHFKLSEFSLYCPIIHHSS